MNTKMLVVGQKVSMRSGPYTKKGKVVKVMAPWMAYCYKKCGVTPRWCVEVELFRAEDEIRTLILFDANGTAGSFYDGLGTWEYIGPTFDWIMDDPRTPGTEYGPWELASTA